MKQQTPFIKRFRTEGSHYIYDANTSRILCVSAAMYDIVDWYWCRSEDDIIRTLNHSHPLPELKKGYCLVNELAVKHKLFSPNRLKSRVVIVIPTEQNVENRLNAGIMQVCLEVTESCNLRCQYCAYSGGYPHNRQHGPGQMSFDTAKAAIDFYLAMNASSKDDLSIGFYGGEPLLRFDLIRDCIDYAKSLPSGQRTRFNLTSNATLFTNEMIKYFVENEVTISVSIDGPQQDHDRHRVSSDGQGTFNKVMERLRRIKRTDPEYYERHVLFNCVFSPASDLLNLNEFFAGDSNLFGRGRLMVAGVSAGNSRFLDNCERSETRSRDNAVLYRMFVDTHIG